MNLALLASVEVNLLLSQVSYIDVLDCAKRGDQILLEIQPLIVPPSAREINRNWTESPPTSHLPISTNHIGLTSPSQPYPYSTHNPSFASPHIHSLIGLE